MLILCFIFFNAPIPACLKLPSSGWLALAVSCAHPLRLCSPCLSLARSSSQQSRPESSGEHQYVPLRHTHTLSTCLPTLCRRRRTRGFHAGILYPFSLCSREPVSVNCITTHPPCPAISPQSSQNSPIPLPVICLFSPKPNVDTRTSRYCKFIATSCSSVDAISGWLIHSFFPPSYTPTFDASCTYCSAHPPPPVVPAFWPAPKARIKPATTHTRLSRHQLPVFFIPATPDRR